VTLCTTAQFSVLSSSRDKLSDRGQEIAISYDQQQASKEKRDVIARDYIRLDYMGPGDSKLLCGPTTIIRGKERCDRKGRKRLEKRKAEKARTESA